MGANKTRPTTTFASFSDDTSFSEKSVAAGILGLKQAFDTIPMERFFDGSSYQMEAAYGRQGANQEPQFLSLQGESLPSYSYNSVPNPALQNMILAEGHLLLLTGSPKRTSY